MNKRGGLLIGIGLVLTAGAGTVTPAVSETRAQGAPVTPNVLLIITDDQRSDHRTMPRTGRRLVHKGARYQNAFATTPACCPSRATIFSGLYSHNHRVTNNDRAARLNPKKTLQYHLDNAGYRTAIVGKYLNKWRRTPVHSPPPFFDSYAVVRGGRQSYYRGGKWAINGSTRTVNRYSTTFIEDWAIKRLKSWDSARDRKPWLLVVSTPAPHAPAPTTRKYRGAKVPDYFPPVEEDKSDKPLYVQRSSASPRRGNRLQRREKRALMPVDDLVGHLSRQLERRKELEDTIIVYISDNGVMWEEHGLSYKSVPYTEDLSVPMYLSWPGRVPARTVNRRLVGNVDVAPTILDAVGLDEDIEQPMDGRSLLDTSWVRDRIHLEYLGHDRRSGAWAATRTKDYQYTEYYDKLGIIIFREYYDLAKDPLQMDNLLGDNDPFNDPPTEPLSDQLESDLNCSGADCP